MFLSYECKFTNLTFNQIDNKILFGMEYVHSYCLFYTIFKLPCCIVADIDLSLSSLRALFRVFYFCTG
jgi:hypothetical protein